MITDLWIFLNLRIKSPFRFFTCRKKKRIPITDIGIRFLAFAHGFRQSSDLD